MTRARAIGGALPVTRAAVAVVTRQRHVVVDPVEGLRDGLLPEADLTVALRGLHLGLPAGVLLPVGAELVEVGPEPDREPCGVGRAERRRLGDDRTHDRHTEDVGLELHERVVRDHAAVDLQLGEVDARVGVHGVEHLAGLERRRLEGRAGDVALVHVPGEADERAARIRAPVRREQAGERRHEVGAAVVLDRLGEVLDLWRARDEPEVVAQPLDQRSRHGDRPLQRIVRPAASPSLYPSVVSSPFFEWTISVSVLKIRKLPVP